MQLYNNFDSLKMTLLNKPQLEIDVLFTLILNNEANTKYISKFKDFQLLHYIIVS